MAPIKKRDHNVRLTLQEGAQKKPWWSYKYNKNRNVNQVKPSTSRSERLDQYDESSVQNTEDYLSPDTPSYSPLTERSSSHSSRKRSSEITNEQREKTPKMGENDEIANSESNSQAVDNSMLTNDVNMASVGAGGSGGGRSTAGIRGTVEMPRGLPIYDNEQIHTYTKSYKFRIQSSLLEYRNQTSNLGNSVFMRYPYHDIPVHMLGFYLSREEIAKIVLECTSAEIEHCKVQVFAHQAQLPFITGMTVTGIANNNIGYYLAKLDPKIQKYRKGIIPSPEVFINNRCWGDHISQLPVSTDFTSANIGKLSAEHIIKDLDMRFEYESYLARRSAKVSVFKYIEHAFPVEKFIEHRWNASFNEGLFCEWEHKPLEGLFHQYGRNGDAYGSIQDSARMKRIKLHEQLANEGATVSGGIANSSFRKIFDDANPDTTVYRPMNPFFNNNTVSNIQIERKGFKVVPPLIIGLETIVTGNINDTPGTLVQCQLILEVRATIKIREKRGVDYMFRYGGSETQPDTMQATYVNNFVFPTGAEGMVNYSNRSLLAGNKEIEIDGVIGEIQEQDVPVLPPNTQFDGKSFIRINESDIVDEVTHGDAKKIAKHINNKYTKKPETVKDFVKRIRTRSDNLTYERELRTGKDTCINRVKKT